MLLAQTLRTSRARVVRLASPHTPGLLTLRSFVASAPARQDLIQDLYVRELKNYKPPPIKPNDSVGLVQKFSPPSLPPSPEEADLASELKAYESSSVEIEGQVEAGSTLKEDDWFEEEPEDEEHAHH